MASCRAPCSAGRWAGRNVSTRVGLGAGTVLPAGVTRRPRALGAAPGAGRREVQPAATAWAANGVRARAAPRRPLAWLPNGERADGGGRGLSGGGCGARARHPEVGGRGGGGECAPGCGRRAALPAGRGARGAGLGLGSGHRARPDFPFSTR